MDCDYLCCLCDTSNAQFTPPARQDKTVLSVSCQAVWTESAGQVRSASECVRRSHCATLRHRPDRTHLSGRRADSVHTATPDTTKQSCLCRVWCGGVNSNYRVHTSVLWRCWLGGRKGIRPVKNWVVRCGHGYLSGARCRLAYGPADTTVAHCLLLQ